MHISILGPLTIHLGENSIVPSAGKPRRLLALLAARCGQVVSVPTLMEELWGEVIPRSGSTTLQTYVLQLRHLIDRALPAGHERGAKEILVTRHNGYQLAVTPDAFDARSFEQLAGRGDAALDAGDAAGASALFDEALGLWDGEPLMDVSAGRVLGMECMRLDEERMRVHSQRIVADLCLGRHAALVPELRTMTAQNPMNENLCALLMIVFQRVGAPSRALQAFQDLRQTLVTELGVDPSARLQSLQRAVLSNEQNLSLQAYDLA